MRTAVSAMSRIAIGSWTSKPLTSSSSWSNIGSIVRPNEVPPAGPYGLGRQPFQSRVEAAVLRGQLGDSAAHLGVGFEPQQLVEQQQVVHGTLVPAVHEVQP